MDSGSRSFQKLGLTAQAGHPQNEESSSPLVAQGDGLANDGLIPQLSISVPSNYSEHSPRDYGASGIDAQEPVTYSSGETGAPSAPASDPISSDGNCSRNTESSNTKTSAPPSLHDEITRTSGDPSLNVGAPSGQRGIRMFQGLIDQARRYLRGSANDIGWLQRDPGMPPVEDGTERFMKIFNSIRHGGVHKLPNSMVYLLIPGLFSNYGPLYFVNTRNYFSNMGLTCHIAKIHSEASVEKNAREIKEQIENFYWDSKKRVLLLGHSKGGVDAAAALSLYWSDLKDKVAGLALAQSPYGGSPIASDLLRERQLGDFLNRTITKILMCNVMKGDIRALEDLTHEKRREFLKEHHLPREVPIVSFSTEGSISSNVLETSHVAHAELPRIASLSECMTAKVPLVMPLGAVMVYFASCLRIRYGEKSDGLVTRRDAEVPGSVVVRPKQKLCHAWLVYSSPNDKPFEWDRSKVCEALLTLLLEVGQKKRNKLAMKDE